MLIKKPLFSKTTDSIILNQFQNGRRTRTTHLLRITDRSPRITPQHPQTLLQSSHQRKSRKHHHLLRQILQKSTRPTKQ